ncbi:carbohydrate ABC transporter permease [Paenibacillus solisilvae]|uniref:Carbohydrate ABC transporter permease n=1 Tax=Paenibacillus solisilvae TaxID=2486751 RepID=A0ABW0VXF1_9BACL
MIVGVAAFTTIYPFIYVISMSISDPSETLKHTIWFLPKGFSDDAYVRVLHNSYLWRSFGNSVFYVAAGTALNLIMSVLAAYPLAKKQLVARKYFVIYLIIPMFFSGGLVPTFLVVNKLGMYDTVWAVIIPGIVTIWNIILVRTYFMTLPYSLQESAYMDGAGDRTILFKIMLPLSKPILAVIVLYCAVDIWNSWFNALIFLPSKELHPLQLFLARVLIFASGDFKTFSSLSLADVQKNMATQVQLKYAVIVISTVPIMMIFPFLQKYFIKGALIGSLKE